MFLRDESIPFCAVVDFSVFREHTLECLDEFHLHKPKQWCYLLVKHNDPDQTLVHWTPERFLLDVMTGGIKASGDEIRSDFGRGVYCFALHTPDASYSAGEKTVPVYFHSKIWYQCVATDDSIAAIRYCFVRNSIPAERVSLEHFSTTPTLDATQTLVKMGYNHAFMKKFGIHLLDNRPLHEICELFN